MKFYRFKLYITEFYDIFKEGTFFGFIFYLLFKLKSSFLKFKIEEYNTSKRLSLIGCGTYQVSINLPCAIKSKFIVSQLTTNGSKSGDQLCELISNKIQIYKNVDSLSKNNSSDAFLLGSPHFLHPKHLMTISKTNKKIYCEKPVAIDQKGLNLIKNIKLENSKNIMIGFNRRFAPLVKKIKKENWLNENKLEIQYRVNFGQMVDNDLNNKNIGGGRLIGTCCHYVDLMEYICNAKIIHVSAIGISNNLQIKENNFSANFNFSNGSIGNLIFTSSGNRKFSSKEQIFISGGSNNAEIIDFHTLKINNTTYRNYKNNYGALNIWKEFYKFVSEEIKSPVSLNDGIQATKITLAIQKSLKYYGKVQKL